MVLLEKDFLTSQKNVSTEEFNNLIIEAIQEKKGHDIVKMDLRGLDASTDFFIVCHGTSDTQVKAIANGIAYDIKKQTGQLPNHTEGMKNGTWVLVDYFNVIIHIFYKDTREFYGLEDLWSDAVVTEYKNL